MPVTCKGNANMRKLPAVFFTRFRRVHSYGFINTASGYSSGMAQNINPSNAAPLTPEKMNEDPSNAQQDNHAVTKRLHKELMQLMLSGEKGISAFPEGENLFNWVATISGATGTVFEGFTYKLTIQFPHAYPYSPPVVKFTSQCYHPNIDLVGNICLDILREKWSPLLDVTTVLLSIQSLLGEPNNDSPLNPQAAAMWKDQAAYRSHLLTHYSRFLSK